MTDDRFKIFVEQLRDGNTEEINETFSPEFLEIKERDLSFTHAVNVQGQVYLAEDMLILHLNVNTIATIPCAICNSPADIEIEIEGLYHAVPLEEIKGAVYDFREILRETILLEVPILAECSQGKCPQRKSLEKYFKKEGAPGSEADEEGYKPFAGLDFDLKD